MCLQGNRHKAETQTEKIKLSEGREGIGGGEVIDPFILNLGIRRQ